MKSPIAPPTIIIVGIHGRKLSPGLVKCLSIDDDGILTAE
jgi:hypothetical protein